MAFRGCTVITVITCLLKSRTSGSISVSQSVSPSEEKRGGEGRGVEKRGKESVERSPLIKRREERSGGEGNGARERRREDPGVSSRLGSA